MRAGEKGLRIFGPVTRRLRADEVASWLAQGRDPFDPDGRPRLVVRGFTVEYVFDLSQVDPGPDAQPLPETRTWIAQRGDGPAGLWPALVALTEAHGFTLDVRPARSEDGGAHGWTNYATRTVWVNSDCDEAERVRILAHETAGHIRCDHEHRRDISRGQRETEADSVAYVVLAALGLDISSSTVEYVADWSRGDTDLLRAAAETVHRVAAAVLADPCARRPCGSATDNILVMVRRPGVSTQPASRSVNTARPGAVNTAAVSPRSADQPATGAGPDPDPVAPPPRRSPALPARRGRTGSGPAPPPPRAPPRSAGSPSPTARTDSPTTPQTRAARSRRRTDRSVSHTAAAS